MHGMYVTDILKMCMKKFNVEKKIIFDKFTWGGGGGGRTGSPMILKLGMQHLGLKLYKVYINGDPGLTLAYLMAKSNWVAFMFEWEKLLQSHLMGENLQQRTILTE